LTRPPIDRSSVRRTRAITSSSWPASARRRRSISRSSSRGGPACAWCSPKVDKDAPDYFEREIQPHIGRTVEWRENVSGEEKVRLLAEARAMVFPIQWEEPFGLAMIEAMVSGTPVLATPRGAATEVVDPGITGWIAPDVDGLLDAYGRLGEIDLRRCAEHAGRRFGPEQMGDGYLAVYEAARLGQTFRKPA